MTTIAFPDPDFLHKWVKSKGWENMTKIERHLVKKACKSHMELAQMMTLKPDKPKYWRWRIFNR